MRRNLLVVVLCGMCLTTAIATAATLQNHICAHFNVADATRPKQCQAIVCTNLAAAVQCGGYPHWSYVWIAYEYDGCTSREGSQCQESGLVDCVKIERHETLGCDDYFTCNQYMKTTGCT